MDQDTAPAGIELSPALPGEGLPHRSPADGNRPHRRAPWRMRLSRLVNPTQWSLSARFLVTTGCLLGFGCLVLALVFIYYQNLVLNESVKSRLSVFHNWMEDRLKNEIDGQYGAVAPLTSMAEVVDSLRRRDREKLKTFILPYLERVKSTTGRGSLYFHFHLPPAVSFLRTWDLDAHGMDLTDQRPMVVKANKYKAAFKGIEVGPGGASVRAIVPVIDGETLIGTVEAATSIDNILQMTQMPPNFGAIFLLDKNVAQVLNPNQVRAVYGNWMAGEALGTLDDQALFRELETGIIPDRVGTQRFRFIRLDDFLNRPIGGVLISFDCEPLLTATLTEAALFGLAFLCGAMLLWFVIYVNVKRIKMFLHRLGRILVATNDGDFTQRFETDPVHCLDILQCGNTNCPVHRNPSLICYLEAGSEAISPTWRNTCIYLTKYRKCRHCPVYALRHGDELVEMRNAVNTMMRIWNDFTGQVNEVISGVLHTQVYSTTTPALNTIGDLLESVSGLTAFTHDLQGVYSKAEVYDMLEVVFTRDFGLNRYLILEMPAQEVHFTVALNRLGDDRVVCGEILHNSDLCRAKRMAEEVVSRPNSALCPFFHVDHAAEVRCCLPLVLGGRVGGVVSFVVPLAQWERKRQAVSIIRKYLGESAPVLATLHLLVLSKEQSLRDPLTGVRNRRFLDEYMGQAEAQAQRENRRVGFIMADLDYFKQVNDQYGHIAGDAVLREIGALLAGCVRQADLVVRFGGEEFLIVLHDVREGYAREVAEKIRRAVEAHDFVLPGGQTLRKTVSLGVAEYPAQAEQFYKAVKFADVALYKAKEAGRNRVMCFAPDMWKVESY